MADSPYIVLARKHRPRQLDEVVGQEHVARTLANAIEQNRVAHALLFTGPRGVGKTSTARILARALNCEHGPTPRPCGTCASCVEIGAGASVDVIEIDAASNRGIDEIRDLRDAVRYPPSRERFKVYIIDEVHMLTTQAFNALLKTLEEPPPRVQFIFATTEPHKIPDTILSRCQRYDFRRIPVERIVEHLASIAATENVEAETGALRLIAQQSEGCMRDAQSLLDQLISFSDGKVEAELAARVLGAVGRDALFRLSEAVLDRDVDQVLGIVDQAYQIGINLVRLASDLLAHLRDLTVAAVAKGDGALLHLTPGERTRLEAQANKSEPTVLHRMFSLLLETAEEMSRSAYPRLMLEMALIRMTAIEPLEPIGSLVKRIEQLAGGGGAGGPVASARSVSPEAGRPEPADVRASEGPNVRASRSSLPEPIEAPADTSDGEPVRSHAVAPPRPRTVEPSDRGTPASSEPQNVGSSDPRTVAPSHPETFESHASRWRRLVEAVGERSLPVGGLLKAAELQDGDGVAFTVLLGGAHFDIMKDTDKRALVEAVARELYGVAATLRFEAQPEAKRTAAKAGGFRVHDAEEEEHRAELARLERMVADHPVTHVVRSVFELDPSQIQITPHLPEEGSLLEPEL